MKNLKNKIAYILLLFTIVTVAACKKFVEIPPPSSQIVTASVFNNAGAATAAMTNIYQQMYSNQESLNMASETGLLGDELTNYSLNNGINQLCYTNSMSATGTLFPLWNNAYNYIYQANAVIEALQNNKQISPAIIKQLTGEAEFIRAFWHFYLVNCYGDVPLVTTTAYSHNASLTRTPKALVYQQVIADLQNAQSLLNSGFVDASDTTAYPIATAERVRPTKWAATALLARAYLYTGDNANAIGQATTVINNSSMFNLVSNLSQVFKKNSGEAIWQIAIPLPANKNTADGNTFILQGVPNDASGQTVALSTQLMSAFEAGDQRKTNWIGTFTTTSSPPTPYYYPYKYQVYNSTTVTEYQMIIRLSELYLIRAEAKAQLGDATSINDLNAIRNRAGLPNYSGATDKTSLLTAVLHERQVELFTEWGHRWFDMIRTNNANTIMGAPGNVCAYKGGTWKPEWQLFPINQNEIYADPQLIQNPGY